MGSSNPAWSEEDRAAQKAITSWDFATPDRSDHPPGRQSHTPTTGTSGALWRSSAPPKPKADELAAEVLPELSPLQIGQCLVLRPGEVPELAAKAALHGTKGVVLRPGELELVNGLHHYHCRIPAAIEFGKAGWPLADRLISIYVRHRPEGRRSAPVRLIYALDAAGQIIGRIDASDTWEMRSDALAQLAAVAGIRYEVYRFDEARSFLAAHPEWVDPQLEWFVNHSTEEAARETTWGIWLGGGLAMLFGGAGMFALEVSRVGPVYFALLMAAALIFAMMTLWSRSRWRMRRSLRRSAYTGVTIASRFSGSVDSTSTQALPGTEVSALDSD